MVKPLWFIAGARKFTIFWDWVDRVNFVDKIIVRYHHHAKAHEIALQYFRQHPEYDSFIISSDDVLGTPDMVRMVIEDYEKHKFPVVSGWCNVKLGVPWASVSILGATREALRTRNTTYDSYRFINMDEILLAKYAHGTWPFFKAWFVGLPLTLVTRETLTKVPFRPFKVFKDRFCVTPDTAHGRGIMFDLQFCWDCAQNKIPITIDSRIFLLHFGFTGNYVLVGKEKPSISVVKATEPLH